MKRLLFVLLAVLFLSVIVVAGSVVYLSKVVSTPLVIKNESLFVIEKGSNAYRTVKQLRNEGYSDIHPVLAKVWLKFFAKDTAVKSGTYALLPGDSLVDVFTRFSNNEEHLFNISLVEGLTLTQWQQTLKGHDNIEYDLDTTTLAKTLNNDVQWCCSDIPHNEGMYLADTYFFTNNTKASDILARAHTALIAYVENQWQQRSLTLPLETPYEALILASIIEKETAVPDERSRIAGVFVNRLNSNMRLQTDPTVIYGIGDSFDGNITRKHLRTATAYNTYVIKGLPPTPIAMAGKAAISAALKPLDTDELYFVARGDGSHQFSTTLEAHNAAVRKYQLKR